MFFMPIVEFCAPLAINIRLSLVLIVVIHSVYIYIYVLANLIKKFFVFPIFVSFFYIYFLGFNLI